MQKTIAFAIAIALAANAQRIETEKSDRHKVIRVETAPNPLNDSGLSCTVTFFLFRENKECMTDGELLRRSAEGDETAFEVLYHRHRDSVYRFAWVLTKSPADAEDVVQECFLTLNRKAAEFDSGRAQLRTWLLGIARNICYRRTRTAEAAITENEVDDPGIEASLIRDELAEAVRRAVLALPEGQREAIALFEFEELSLAETASALGIEPNAVKARLYRGREMLKKSLAPLRLPEGKDPYA
jgi:RNA polymerase sigma-70 factor (ECF subfamily)